MFLSFEEFLARPDTPERRASRAALAAEHDLELAETAAAHARTAAAYELAALAPNEEAGMAILAAHSAELVAEHLAKTGLKPAPSAL